MLHIPPCLLAALAIGFFLQGTIVSGNVAVFDDNADQAAITSITASADPLSPPSSAKVTRVDASAVTRGRQLLSTAFVRIGPDGLLTVEMHDGRMFVLRDVVMGARDYCGSPVPTSASGKRFCGSYEDVASARPGGPPVRDVADPGSGQSAIRSQ